MIQADAFSGYEALTRLSGRPGANVPRITHAACMAHARRKLFDEFERTKSPIAEEALRRIGELYAIEAEINGQSAEHRQAARQERAVPILDGLRLWFEQASAAVLEAPPRQGDPIRAHAVGGAHPLHR